MAGETKWLSEASHFDFGQTITIILAVLASGMCIQDSFFKLLNTLVLCCCCGNDDFSLSAKLWKLLIAIIQILIASTVLYTLYEFDFNEEHINNNTTTTSNHGFDFSFVCKNTNIINYVNSLNFVELKYENLLLLWLISFLTNLNYFLEGALQCSIDNMNAPDGKKTNKPNYLGIFALLYTGMQAIIIGFLFPTFCWNHHWLKYAFIADACITLAVLLVYFTTVPRVSHFDCGCCDSCSPEDLETPRLCGFRSGFVISIQLLLIFYIYLVTVEFDTMIGILLWLSSLCVRILVYFLTPEHEITQWLQECFVTESKNYGAGGGRNRRQDGMGSLGSGIELTMPKRNTGAYQSIQLPAAPLSAYDGNSSNNAGYNNAPLTIPSYDNL